VSAARFRVKIKKGGPIPEPVEDFNLGIGDMFYGRTLKEEKKAALWGKAT
jgi:hypothetical protein